MQDIDQIIDQAIAYTRTVLRTAPEHLDAARAGLERLRNNLMLNVPDHPALERLQAFLHELDRRASDQPLH